MRPLELGPTLDRVDNDFRAGFATFSFSATGTGTSEGAWLRFRLAAAADICCSGSTDVLAERVDRRGGISELKTHFEIDEC